MHPSSLHSSEDAIAMMAVCPQVNTVQILSAQRVPAATLDSMRRNEFRKEGGEGVVLGSPSGEVAG
eukprot:713284-Heterocapsa_arctica.AAC.1